jgi:prepilin-type N-terminal cleavage/methylation domain-containing protein
MKRIYNTKKSGFSLVESMISIFLFSLVAVLLSGVFSNFLKNYLTAKKTQMSAESAQYAINLMSKSLRTSSVISTGSFPLKSYDYSQNMCILYSLTSGKITTGRIAPTAVGDINSCVWTNINSANTADLTPDDVEIVNVEAIATDMAGKLGRVTVALKIKEIGQTSSALPIQMTVSLRQ